MWQLYAVNIKLNCINIEQGSPEENSFLRPLKKDNNEI